MKKSPSWALFHGALEERGVQSELRLDGDPKRGLVALGQAELGAKRESLRVAGPALADAGQSGLGGRRFAQGVELIKAKLEGGAVEAGRLQAKVDGPIALDPAGVDDHGWVEVERVEQVLQGLGIGPVAQAGACDDDGLHGISEFKSGAWSRCGKSPL